MVITAAPATSSSITAGSEFTVTIAMENSQGQVPTGATGTVTIALASGPSGPSLGGTLTLPVSQGIATFDDLTLDQAAVGYELRATASGLAPVSTSAFGVAPAAASQLVVSAQPPSSVTAGQPFGLGVTVEDRFGNVETGYTGSVTVAISTNPGAAKLGGTLTAAVDQGIATFTGLTLDQPGTGYILQATAPNLPAVTTAALDVTAPAGGQTNRNAPTQMVVTLQPSSASTIKAGSPFTVTIELENSQGQVQTGATGTVTIALASDPGGGTLGGTLTVAVSQGIATFDDLTLEQAGNGYTIQATSGKLPVATTTAFNVAAATTTSPPPGGARGPSRAPGVAWGPSLALAARGAGSQSTNSTPGDVPTGGSSTSGNGSTSTGTSSTADSGESNHGKGKSKHKHHPGKKADRSSSNTHKPPSRHPGHQSRTKSHHAEFVVPAAQGDIRFHPLLRRKLIYSCSKNAWPSVQAQGQAGVPCTYRAGTLVQGILRSMALSKPVSTRPGPIS